MTVETSPNPVETLEVLDKPARDLLFHAARTANSFTDEPVTDEQLQSIYDLVRWAPTALNAQPLRALAVRSPEARERLVEVMADGNKAKTLTAPLTLVVAADTDFHEHLPRLMPAIPGAKDFFQDDTAREKSARFNAALQLGYLILGIRAEGLAAGPMTGADFDGIDAEFFAGSPWRSFAVVNVGHPAEDAFYPRAPRLEYDEAVRVA